MVVRVCLMIATMTLCSAVQGFAGQEPAAPHVHQQADPAPPKPEPAWHLMQDGAVYGLFNRQGGPRGGTEFIAPNWWMGMLMRSQARHQLGVNVMLSADAATTGKDGYREIFQVGESLDGQPLVDRQHPHDLLMQLAASWQMRTGDRTAFVVAGGPAGEPTLGPVAFMHRPSAAGLPLAPLGHHTFDSTHTSFGVVTAAVEHGRWSVEGSAFNGREPDDDRWDLDLGALDSVAGRLWFRPTPEWALQVSTGFLREPEALEPGDARRTTASASWMRSRTGGFRAAAAGYGVTSAHDRRRHGVFAELTDEWTSFGFSGRLEIQQVESAVLITGQISDHHDTAQHASIVTALTVAAARPVGTWAGFEAALAAQATLYGVPTSLRATHGQHPASFQLFLRVRLPTGKAGRMWNMRMSSGQRVADGHAGHVMP